MTDPKKGEAALAFLEDARAAIRGDGPLPQLIAAEWIAMATIQLGRASELLCDPTAEFSDPRGLKSLAAVAALCLDAVEALL